MVLLLCLKIPRLNDIGMAIKSRGGGKYVEEQYCQF